MSFSWEDAVTWQILESAAFFTYQGPTSFGSGIPGIIGYNKMEKVIHTRNNMYCPHQGDLEGKKKNTIDPLFAGSSVWMKFLKTIFCFMYCVKIPCRVIERQRRSPGTVLIGL